MSARTSRLVQVLAGPEVDTAPKFLTGVVRAVTTSTTQGASTVDVDVDGVTVEGVHFRDGMDPEEGQLVWLLRQGPLLIVLGSPAPARVVVAEHNHTSPPVNPASPAAPGAAPSAPASVRTVSVVAVDSGTWQPSYSSWREDQVGQSGDGRRGFWFYGGAIAAAKGSGTITAGSIFIKRQSAGGVNGGANVRLGTHAHTSQPVSGGTALSNVSVVGTLTRGQGGSFALSAAQIAALNAGAVGLGLEPGSSGYTSADYLLAEPFSAGDWSGALQLTVEG